MIASLIDQRTAGRLRLSAAELAFLASLEQRTLKFRRHQLIQPAGEPAGEAYVLRSGWAMTLSQLESGARQVRRLHFPGDMLAMPSLAMRHHAADVEAVSDVVVSRFRRSDFAQMFERFPRLTGLMFVFAQAERLVLGDLMAVIGRESSKARMAFLLVDILHRLRRIDPAMTNRFEMLLTRAQMAEVIAITPVHTSRMWSRMIAEGFIRPAGRILEIVDEPGLVALSGYVDRTEDLDFSWLPPSRDTR
ncbi:MAG TPA: Crp/Fnr family transcriptional regulator [Allosphingosinicella sp.]|nr:Crp/Fnr family transcriptional regulator [Allosphingosinicella sp.]